MANFQLKLDFSPSKVEFYSFNLLTELESERTPHGTSTTEINEIKAQLDIVNEDRERLKFETENLKHDMNHNLYAIITENIKTKAKFDNEKVEIMNKNIEKLRKDCEEKDKLLNSMRKLLGNNDLSFLMKENQGVKYELTPIKPRRINRSPTKTPMTRRNSSQNRSISPFSKLF
jgi:predicted RNase H-like nuclease (RuvC/YqgF family)